MKRSALFGLALLLGGCIFGGIDEPSLWRVSRTDLTPPESCFPPGQAPSSRREPGRELQLDEGTWEIYEGANDRVYLSGVEVPDACGGPGSPTTLEGQVSDDVYTFDATGVCKFIRDPGTRIDERKLRTAIRLTRDGDTFTGTWRIESTWNCLGGPSGSTCPATFATENPNCSVEYQVYGTRIEAETTRVAPGAGN